MAYRRSTIARRRPSMMMPVRRRRATATRYRTIQTNGNARVFNNPYLRRGGMSYR
jgi:hypothetical protein